VVTAPAAGRPCRRRLAALRPRGTLVLKSTFAGDAALNLSAIVVDEITDRRLALRPVRAGAGGACIEGRRRRRR
jgi:hypothetical protein